MRRKEREITDTAQIKAVIESCRVMRIAMQTEDVPYIVPLNFGYTYDHGSLELCFHCANEGRKLKLLKINPLVGFEMDCGHELITGETACSYGYRFQSIIGCGRVEVISAPEEKIRLLQLLMSHQTGQDFTIDRKQAEAVTVCKIAVQSLSAKEHS